MIAVGICVGASTISRVDIEKSDGKIRILNRVSRVHEGNIRKTFLKLLSEEDLKAVDRLALTGRKFKNLIRLTSISEPEAVENAYSFLKGKYGQADYISCAGGETFTTYQVDSCEKIINILTGSKCASGTGEFFLQQIKRMGISLGESMAMSESGRPYKVSGRCSVFCKSDCTHALNKGHPKENIIGGLCEMMASRILEHLDQNVSRRVWLTGGCSRNEVMVGCLKNSIANLVIPEEADCFEALGCAVWALDNRTIKAENCSNLFVSDKKSFSVLPPLSLAVPRVEFKDIKKTKAKDGDRCILGLDVGSTTTKAVLMREEDNALLANVYIKTLGDPVKAARFCYMSIKNELNSIINIVGLGVTGSGRQIAGIHALTDSVYNEISAHAAAAVYFDPEVDTIFEIGGQDAKYTHLINRIPSDYAMNEACSAGTGSFLEESASEYLNIDVHEIVDYAMKGSAPPDFNDQCAAFIGSDIKTAMQEDIGIEDIVAGLVYSICKNYLNRVKGSRFVGKKIFMQGGVCYNKAVPAAMASLLERNIIVPPEPGLMGAFGVALMVKEKLENGLLEERCFNLNSLIQREVRYEKTFACAGGNTKCDRRCSISVINIGGKKYPFGGICGKYSSIRTDREDGLNNNLVKLREQMIYSGVNSCIGSESEGKSGLSIGINKSLLVNTLFPLYYSFFTRLGVKVVLPQSINPDQMTVVKKDSAFCYPVNLAHEYYKKLIDLNPDYIFLPHVKGMHVENGIPISLTCPLVQGESYYLRTAYDNVDSQKIIAPVLDFARGYDKVGQAFVEVGRRLGFDRKAALNAYRYAVERQEEFIRKSKETGIKLLKDIEKTGEKAVVLFGRPYNALVRDGNMGIPEKFASKGYRIIPYDFLPLEEEKPQKKMYWTMGQMILKAAKLVSRHPQLFGVFVTNFSCGPDSFVISYFRDIMGNKPSLTLELDSHTADAGIDTRIDAFIDVMKNYCQQIDDVEQDEYFRTVFDERTKKVKTVSGQYVSLKDSKVRILVPSMGHIGSRALAAAFRYVGIDAVALDPPAERELQLGRANSTCKECLPLILTVGSLLNYLDKNDTDDRVLVYFMPEAPDPCRFGQYHVYTESLLMKMGVRNVALLTLSSGNSYGGLEIKYKLRAWQAVVISDVFEDIYSALLVLAEDKNQALKIFNSVVEKVIGSMESDNWEELKRVLKESALELSIIPLRESIEKAKKVAVVGEIYVRRDSFSRQFIVEKLASKGIVSKVASVTEWVYYCDYLVNNNLSEDAGLGDKLNVYVESIIRSQFEKEYKDFDSVQLLKEHLFQMKTQRFYIEKSSKDIAVIKLIVVISFVASIVMGVIFGFIYFSS